MPFKTTIPVGPCQVVAGTVTIDRANNVLVRDQVLMEEIVYDEDGAAPADRMNVGDLVQVEMDIARDDWEDFATLLPTLDPLGAGPTTIERKTRIGELDSSITILLTLKPYVNGVPSSDNKDHFIFPKAAVKQVFEFSHAARGQRAWHIMFDCYRDTVNNRFYYKGSGS